MELVRSPRSLTAASVLWLSGCGAVAGSPQTASLDGGAHHDALPDASCNPICPATCGTDRCLTIVAHGLGGPFELVGDGEAIYWTEYTAGRVGVATRGDAPAVATFASGMIRPIGIAMDTDHVYVADNARGIYVINRHGSAVPVLLGGATPYDISVSTQLGSIVYGSRAVEGDLFVNAPVSPTGQAMALPYTDGGTEFRSGPTAGVLGAVSEQRDGIYAACATQDDDGGVLYFALYNQVAPQFQATDHDNAQSIVDTPMHGLYWANPTRGTLVRGSGVTIATGHAPASADGHQRFSRLVVSDTYVFWTSSAEGTVLRTPIGGGETVTLASRQGGPVGIALAGNDVYWANYLGGTIVRTTQ